MVPLHDAFFLAFTQIELSHKNISFDLIFLSDRFDLQICIAQAKNGSDCCIGDILPSLLKLICRQICNLI